MGTDMVRPVGLPETACPDIRQERHKVSFGEPGADQFVMGAYACARHGIALGDDLEKCKLQATRPDWYPCWYRRGERTS